MNKIDARKLTRDAQQQLRNQAIRLRNKGLQYKSIADILDIHISTVIKWYSLYKKYGKVGIILKKRGLKLGTNRKLNLEQTRILTKILINKTPESLNLPFLLWTRRVVQTLISSKWSISISISTIGVYLKRLGFTPQKPLRKAYEQNPKAVHKWLNQDYPLILKRARYQKGQIHWVDETGIRPNNHYGRSYSPKGKTPIINIKVQKIKMNLISSITNSGKLRFMTYETSMNSQKLLKFMKRLIKDSKHKIFVIMDNLKVHHSKMVISWIENHKEFIEIFHLPSYSPELNPDEYLNCDLKKSFYSGSPARNIKQLKNKVIQALRTIQRSPKRIINYFKHPKINYAA